jgi:hypothetical protein
MELMQKPPSWNQIRANATQFAARWADETDENAGSQSFWNEFLQIFGIDRKRVATFEARAQRASTGGRGRIDLLWPGVLVAEHKSAGKDLAAAEDQAIDYLESIGDAAFPGHVITSDFGRMRIRDLGGDNQPYEFPLKDLPKEIDRFGFIAGYSSRRLSPEQERAVDIAAAQLMASLYERLAETGMSDHEISILLIRLLFLLFGDDTGLWERGLFLEFLETRTQPDGSDLGAQLTLLFQTLDRPLDRRPSTLDELLLRFPYVNGGLFADRLDIPTFTADMRTALVECCHIDWGSIVPAIFGSLFQSVKSREARRTLGEHYTTEDNILKVIGPLFLDELRHEFELAYHDVRKLRQLREKLGTLKFLDPACGCGNFLIITYRLMRRLELDIMQRLAELTGETQLSLDPTLGLRVSPAQFYGIELEEWPAKIAETAMFLVDHQCNLELARHFGEAPDRLPISTNANIVNGNALKLDWASLLPPTTDVFVLGNPPFVGQYTRTEEQTADLKKVWGSRYNGYLDYVTGWYIKTMDYYGTRHGRWAFVSTNSISQGEPVAALWEPILGAGWRIRFAHRTFLWTSEAPGAAAVHAVIVGFDRETTPEPLLVDYASSGRGDGIPKHVSHINPYLIDGPDVVVTSRPRALTSDLPAITYGSKVADGGFLLVDADQYAAVAADPHAARYLRPFIGARELIHGEKKWCLWMQDLDPADVRASQILRDRIAGAKAMRAASNDKEIREAAARPATFLRNLQPTSDYLAIPAHVGEARHYFPVGYFAPDVITGNHNFVASDPDGLLFGLLSSSLFMTWMRMVSGRITINLRFSKTLTWNNFPMPELDTKGREAVCTAAKAVLAVRGKYPTKSLADLYDPLAMPSELVAAHRKLDREVARLFGGSEYLDNEADLMRALLDRYQALATKDQIPLTTSASTPKQQKVAKPPSHSAAVRAWAVDNGLSVPARGRIPKEVMDAYTQARSRSDAPEA